MVKRIGLLGGSFDPLHLGHLWIATFAREQIPLDAVQFVPAAVPPHKREGTRAPYAFRYEMVERALEGLAGFAASPLEADASRPSFTIDTITRLRATLEPGNEVWLLLGADSLHDMPQWRSPDRIVALAGLGVYGRRGHRAAPPPGARIRWIDGPECGLSSTLIRERLRLGLEIRGMVPESIREMIERSPHYREGGGNG